MGNYVADVFKVCSKCKEEKPNNEFYRFHKGIHGTKPACSVCEREKSRLYRADPKTRPIRRALARKTRAHIDIHAKVDQLLWWSKSRAKKSGIGHTVTKYELRDILKKQDNRCALTGREFSLTPYDKNGVSLDRIDNDSGYHVENVQIVTSSANMAKSVMTEEELYEMCCDIIMTIGGSYDGTKS